MSLILLIFIIFHDHLSIARREICVLGVWNRMGSSVLLDVGCVIVHNLFSNHGSGSILFKGGKKYLGYVGGVYIYLERE